MPLQSCKELHYKEDTPVCVSCMLRPTLDIKIMTINPAIARAAVHQPDVTGTCGPSKESILRFLPAGGLPSLSAE